MLSILALLALALLAWPDPEPPPAPNASLDTPRIPAPHPTLPPVNPSIPDPPSVPIPDISPPGLPGGGGGESTESQSPPPGPPPGPEHRTELTHEHHHRWLWEIDPPLLVLAALGLALAWPLSRIPRRAGRLAGAATATALVGLATAAAVVGIDPESGPGTYSRRPVEIERIDGVPEVIVRHVHLDHFHPPVHLATHWLLLGLGLVTLAMWEAWVAARRRSPREPGSGVAETPA